MRLPTGLVPLLATVTLSLPSAGYAGAQDKPATEAATPEQQLLEDFGSGLRIIGYFAKQDGNPGMEDLNLRELVGAAEDALFTEESDKAMSVYLDDFEANRQQEELGRFSEELKAAVASGSMSDQDAMMTWFTVMGGEEKSEDGSERTWEQRFDDHVRSGRLSGINLRVPDGGDMRVLTRPEFLRRDLQYFGRELELDESTRAIIGVLLEDYVNAYEERTRELLDAVRETRMNMGRQWRREKVSNARSGIENLRASVDLDMIRNRIANDERFGGKGEWMLGALDRYEVAIEDIRRAVDTRHTDLERDPGAMTDPSAVLGMAARLQADRGMMRARLMESMMLVLDEGQRRELERIVDQFILEQARVDSKLGGSRIDLELALAVSLDGAPTGERLRAALDGINLELVALADNWTAARIDRERSGLELFVVAESQGESGARRLTGVHAQRARTELEAAISIRDRLISAQEEIAELLQEDDPTAAERLRSIAREQGFAPQMRPRWSERALDAALICDSIDEEQRTALVEMRTELAEQLTPIRLDAIRLRMMTEPRIVRSRIQRMTDPDKVDREALGMERWREAGSERFVALDDQVSERITALMIEPACADIMPARRLSRLDMNKGKDGKGDAKAEGKGQDKGQGRGGGKGQEKGSNRGGGKGAGRSGSIGKS